MNSQITLRKYEQEDRDITLSEVPQIGSYLKVTFPEGLVFEGEVKEVLHLVNFFPRYKRTIVKLV